MTCPTSSASATRPWALASWASRYEPFQIRDPNRPPDNVALTVPTDRFTRRLGLLDDLEKAGFGATGGADRVQDHRTVYKQTASMVLSPRIKAFDLSEEN